MLLGDVGAAHAAFTRASRCKLPGASGDKGAVPGPVRLGGCALLPGSPIDGVLRCSRSPRRGWRGAGAAAAGAGLAWGEWAGDKFDGGVGGAEHEAEALDLLVGDGGGSWWGGGGSVDEESVESGCGLEEGAALWFGAVDEDGGWYDDVVDVASSAVAPDA